MDGSKVSRCGEKSEGIWKCGEREGEDKETSGRLKMVEWRDNGIQYYGETNVGKSSGTQRKGRKTGT